MYIGLQIDFATIKNCHTMSVKYKNALSAAKRIFKKT